MGSMISYFKVILPHWKQPAPPMRIVRLEAQEIAFSRDTFGNTIAGRARRIVKEAPERLAIYPVKLYFWGAIRIQQAAMLMGLLTVPAAALSLLMSWLQPAQQVAMLITSFTVLTAVFFLLKLLLPVKQVVMLMGLPTVITAVPFLLMSWPLPAQQIAMLTALLTVPTTVYFLLILWLPVKQAVMLTALLATFTAVFLVPILWPLPVIAVVCFVGAAWYYCYKQKELLRRPIVRAVQQADTHGPALRYEHISEDEATFMTGLPGCNLPDFQPCRLGGYAFRGARLLSYSIKVYFAECRAPYDPDLMVSSEGSNAISPFLSQLRQTLHYLENPADPLQVRAAIKRAGNVAWYGQVFTHETCCSSVAGVFFRETHLFAFNMGSNRVLLCKEQGLQRLTVDHGQYDKTEHCKRVPKQTPLMATAGLSRGLECSTHPNAGKQRPQVTSIPLLEAKDGLLVIINAAVSEVISDQTVNAYVAKQNALNRKAQEIADGLTCAAVRRQRLLGRDVKIHRYTPGVMVVRPPAPGSPNTQNDPSPEFFKPLI